MKNIEKEELDVKQAQLLKRFGAHLKELRQEHKLTQTQLAKLVDMERTHYSRLEAGNHNPSLFLIERICIALKIELKDFFENFKKRSKR